jgi:hypothetical protein
VFEILRERFSVSSQLPGNTRLKRRARLEARTKRATMLFE